MGLHERNRGVVHQGWKESYSTSCNISQNWHKICFTPGTPGSKTNKQNCIWKKSAIKQILALVSVELECLHTTLRTLLPSYHHPRDPWGTFTALSAVWNPFIWCKFIFFWWRNKGIQQLSKTIQSYMYLVSSVARVKALVSLLPSPGVLTRQLNECDPDLLVPLK